MLSGSSARRRSYSSQNPFTAAVARPSRAGSSPARRAASSRLTRSASAPARSLSTVRAPIPRRGVFITRRHASSSRGLTRTWR